MLKGRTVRLPEPEVAIVETEEGEFAVYALRFFGRDRAAARRHYEELRQELLPGQRSRVVYGSRVGLS